MRFDAGYYFSWRSNFRIPPIRMLFQFLETRQWGPSRKYYNFFLIKFFQFTDTANIGNAPVLISTYIYIYFFKFTDKFTDTANSMVNLLYFLIKFFQFTDTANKYQHSLFFTSKIFF